MDIIKIYIDLCIKFLTKNITLFGYDINFLQVCIYCLLVSIISFFIFRLFD